MIGGGLFLSIIAIKSEIHRVFFPQLGFQKASEFDTIRTTMLIFLKC